jgi:hypothetical protein
MTLFLLALLVVPVFAAPGEGRNGTTLAGYKTLDICSVNDTTWRYSGVISVWNEGAVDTDGFAISDFIEYKTGTEWVKAFDVPIVVDQEIPSGTTQLTAVIFPYSYDSAPLSGTIRNNASLTILNHSGSLGEPKGPNPKATYGGTLPPPPCEEQQTGCTYTHGYWWKKPDVIWPSPYNRDAMFYISEQTWMGVLNTTVNTSRGYYQLAHQFIAAVLNMANGADVPVGVQDTINLATTWFEDNAPSACTANDSCGIQKDWASTLDKYNNGIYPGGPSHCGDESIELMSLNWAGWQFELRLPLVITK